mgnify:CR=1 FL=1
MNEENKAWLDKLHYEKDKQQGNLEVAYSFLDKEKTPKWSKWRKYLDAQSDEKFLSKVNNRTILPNEIVLDIEEPEKFNGILEQVKRDFEFYSAYKTGSKGYHIHLWFNRDLSCDEKKAVIKKYQTDEQKAGDRCMIALENCPHWKTGSPKILIEEKKGFNLLKIEKEMEKGKVEISPEILEKFKSPNLLNEIKSELDKTHIEDDNLKMTGFFVGISGLQKNPKKRMSMALTGDSSVGKDNLIRTILNHMPDETYLFLTSATQPALEDEAIYTPIIAVSEINIFREGGANKNILELVKQRTEGGTSAIKKDAETQFKTTKKERTEQGSVFYGTTDAERNNESETRFIFGHVEANEKKIIKVNLDTISKFSEIDKLLEFGKQKDSWLKQGISKIRQDFYDCEIIIPYANVLLESINGLSIIDNTSPRSMRDLKRLLSLTSAVAFLFSYQRKVVEYGEIKILVSEPEDLINTIKYAREFFNETYSGMDKRLNAVLEFIDSGFGEWVARDSIQRHLKVSLNTMKGWISNLESEGLIEGTKGCDLNFKENSKNYDGNKIYLKRCQKGVKKMLIRCEENELRTLLEKEKVSIDDTLKQLLQGKSKVSRVSEGIEEEKNNENLPKNNENLPKNSEIDTFELTPLDIDFSKSGIKETLEDSKNE